MTDVNEDLLRRQVRNLSGNDKEIEINPPEKEIKSQ